MQPYPVQNETAAPTFWQLVFGVVIGNVGCLVANLLFWGCLTLVLVTVVGVSFGNIFSRITNGAVPGFP